MEADKILQFLGKLKPASTVAASIFSPKAKEQVILGYIWINNVSSSPVKYSLYFNDNGVVYDDTTSIAKEVTITPGKPVIIDLKLPMRRSSGNLAVQSDTADAINFMIFGER